MKDTDSFASYVNIEFDEIWQFPFILELAYP